MRPVWELCHGYLWQWSLCSRVLMLAMPMWLRQGDEPEPRALVTAGWLPGILHTGQGPGLRDRGVHGQRARTTGSLCSAHLSLLKLWRQRKKKQRKRTIRYFLPKCQWTVCQCLLMCDFQITEISILPSLQAYCQLWPCILKLMFWSYLYLYIM